MRIQKLNSDTKKNLLEDLLKRSPNNYGQYEASVKEILDKVKEEKDAAVFAYTAKFDGAELTADTIEVTDAEIEEAYAQVDDTLLTVIRKAKDNIESYHAKQRQNSWFDSKPDGTILGQKITPLHRVGVYVPGGKAVYPSSVLMNVMPAKVAGVDEIIMVTPPGKNGKVSPNTLVAAKEAGVDKIYKVGGAQAIAALAYGTESIPKVDKIVGPGNIYVALAKKAVYGHVSIDSIAGPSEILVLADETANPRYVAADLLSQAEHDEMASAILVTTSEELARKVSDEIDGFLNQLSRKEIMEKSLDSFGYILVASDMKEAIDTANAIASEHMEIMTANPFDVMTRIKNAGAIFIYSKTNQGAVLGALTQTFDKYLYEMLKCLYRDNETCTFDPLCMNTSNGSCCACTYLDEVACEHFNKDLSRRLLYGYEEKGTDEKIINFWEEI